MSLATLARVSDDDIDRAERVMADAVREAIDAGLRGDDAARYAIARLLADERATFQQGHHHGAADD